MLQEVVQANRSFDSSLPLMALPLPAFIDHFEPLARQYDVILCDVWGVIHNSIVSFPAACDALLRFRGQGGTVILITNAPRPGAVVARYLDGLAVAREAYDGIVSSGDVTRRVVAERLGERVFHLGPERDLGIFAELDVRLAPVSAADYVVCSGLFDDEGETPDDYRELLTELRARDLFMVCANPDLVVERGSKLVYCAGALADLYHSLGGDVLYAGKPHSPIYDEALAKAAGVRGRTVARDGVLTIGDSIRTDLKGAVHVGLDCLFVTGGIHAEELRAYEASDAGALAEFFAPAGAAPKAVTRRLTW
jgi:HAD superfamily hydrolase (TIGR01459 family)